MTSPLQGLIHSSLGIHSLLKRQPVKHNVIDRDKVVLPPNWDSWGKIRVLREGFDVEAVNKGWSLDIEEPESNTPDAHSNEEATEPEEPANLEQGAVYLYEQTIRDPSLDALQTVTAESNGMKLEVSSLDPQTFLASQLEILETLRQDGSATDSGRPTGRQVSASGVIESVEGGKEDEGRVSEHIGPVQFNMGGIQVDADDMLQRLKVLTFPLYKINMKDAISNIFQDRQTYQTPEPTTPGGAVVSPDGKSQNEALASFFAGLMKRGGGSAASSPKPTS